MKAFELVGEVDDRHCLLIALPGSVLPGKVRVIVLTPDLEEDEAGEAWMNGISREWAEELLDSRQGIYTLEDGELLSDNYPSRVATIISPVLVG